MRAKHLLLSAVFFSGITPALAIPPPPPSAAAWDLAFGGSISASDYDFRGVTMPVQPSARGSTVAAYLESQVIGNWGVQFDGVVNLQRLRGLGGTADISTFDVAAHGFYRMEGSWLLGAFGQFRQGTLSSVLSGASFETDFLGLEGQYTWNNFTFYGQTAFQRLSTTVDRVDGWLANAQLRYFVTPNWRTDIRLGYSQFADSGAKISTYSLSLGTQYQLEAMPQISLFARYDRDCVHLDYPGSSSLLEEIGSNTYTIGAVWAFDTRSLKARNDSGASLEPVRPSGFSFGF